MRSIYLYCDGGFGNRFNGLVSGLIIAKAAGLHPLVVWPRNNWCRAGFIELFQNSEFTVIERELIRFLPLKNQLHFLMTEDHLKMGVSNQSPLTFQNQTDVLTYLDSGTQDVFFHSPLIPSFLKWPDVRSQIRSLNFQNNILDRVNSFLAQHQLSAPFYGIQIRKTDFAASGADDEALFQLAAKALDQCFFVCSDEQSVEQKFATLPNVTCHEKQAYVEKRIQGNWNRLTADESGRLFPCNIERSAQSVIDAVVDLLILSHSEIINTSNSTFLNTAKLLKASRS